MERKLQFKNVFVYLIFTLIGLITVQTFGQSISTPTVIENAPLKVSFDLTNGNGSINYFNDTNTQYSYELSPGGLVFGSFSVNNPPASSNGSSQTGYQRTVYAPIGTAEGDYSIRINSTNPTAQSGFSNPFSLFNDFEIDDLSSTGYVQCQTPATTYRVVTITNTGNIIDKYDLSLNQNIPPDTEQDLDSDILTLEGDLLVQSPQLLPGASYTFMIRFSAVNGTQPAKNNYTELIVTSQNDNTFSKPELIHTYTYCGNGNNIPSGPDSPDLKIVKSTNVSSIAVGGLLKYTLTISNPTPKNALTPTILDTIPSNVEVVAYYKQASDTRNIIVDYDQTTRLFQASYPTGGNIKFDDSSPPINVYIEVIPNCHSAPEVVNRAYVTNNAGDDDLINNVSSTTTEVVFDLSDISQLGNWTGGTSNDWFDCANWSKGYVPDNSIDVTIQSSAPNQPNIDDSDIARSRSLLIEGGANLSMEVNSELQVSGNWTNNGNFVPGNGTVAFVGSNNQQVIDILGTPTFSNLKINTTNSAKVFISNDQGLYVNNQLNLQSGVLRLEGMSQLLQPNSGTVIATTGKLWREQRGDANEYNYNYWSSPVGTTSTNYQIANVMKDGSDILNPQNIEWTGGDNGAPTTPITISNRWLYKFQSTSPLYANWQKIYQNDPIQAGLGYTMKGSGTNDPSETQNYIFVGVPFTGNITHTISNDQIALLGNPYTSALDANLFIQQNSGVIDGTLQFWDHFITTNSHNLDQYKGGYAKYNQTSQIVAVNVDNVSSTKVPQQFIPVGQGFFVSAEPGISNNSPIVFRNSQRAFVKEDEAGGMQMFGIPDGSNTSAGTFDGPTKIKLNMISAGDYKHQIAIGFMQDKATEEIDYGYDAKLRDTDPNQFYFMHPDEKLVIQGVGYFDEENKYPLGVIADAAGRYTFTIGHIENLAENTAVYLYDNEKQIYHNLRKSDYFVNLASGEYNTRFSLRFKNFALENDLNTQQLLNNIVVYHQNNYVIITNPSEETTILKATMFNMLGQNVTSWNIENGRESHIELPLQSLAAGVYVVQVQTDQGSVSKKINIK